MNRVLAFGCHPDDVEFMAAGTLLLLAKRGFEVHIATMTGGEVGHPTLSPKDIREVRLKEAAASAAFAGGYYHYAGGCDLEVEYSAAYRRMAVRVMREVDPLIVLTHPPMDYLVDHEETSKLVRTAAFIASVPNFDRSESMPATARIPYLYYWNATGLADVFGRPLPLSCVVDISSVINEKSKMLGCHASQREWLAYINNWDSYTENMLAQSKKQGELIGAPYGEGFIRHAGNGHPGDDILQDVMNELCVGVRSKSGGS